MEERGQRDHGQEFEALVGQVGTRRGAKQQAVLDAFAHMPAQFRFSDIERACPGVSRPTIERVLQRLRSEGRASCVRAGRGALWEKRDPAWQRGEEPKPVAPLHEVLAQLHRDREDR